MTEQQGEAVAVQRSNVTVLQQEDKKGTEQGTDGARGSRRLGFLLYCSRAGTRVNREQADERTVSPAVNQDSWMPPLGTSIAIMGITANG